jgi:hypothetical protein
MTRTSTRRTPAACGWSAHRGGEHVRERAIGFEIVGTVPEAFRHPVDGYVGLHVMYRRV